MNKKVTLQNVAIENTKLSSIRDSMRRRPSKDFLLKDSNNNYTIHARAYVDMIQGLVLYSTNNELSYTLTSFEEFFYRMQVIPM
ncbi:hypothetical protein CQA53_05695 [Helicobacter didelphidarum]|uniref:Uncharacterized protein n=1 Tax=Helicobacter didelphidarum TaxID=2040648 RepID=A0A3D8ILJ5_9HELI|nr:hypothetical protein [Helicobacter didelphidarum]RDU65786.1 hypothetical protein CQA53_05695 [Helicobacter didelphidarum]